MKFCFFKLAAYTAKHIDLSCNIDVGGDTSQWYDNCVKLGVHGDSFDIEVDCHILIINCWILHG